MPPYSGYSHGDLEDPSLSSSIGTQNKQLHQEKQRPRNEVRFSDFDDIFEIVHVNDLTDEEYFDSYFTTEELGSIRSECMSIVNRMDIKDDLGDMCVRGLDHHTEEYDSWRKQIRNNLREAVLEAQELLHARGILAPEMLAELSQKFSVELVEAAKVFGMYDAIHADD